jgi:hypothetical protein
MPSWLARAVGDSDAMVLGVISRAERETERLLTGIDGQHA